MLTKNTPKKIAGKASDLLYQTITQKYYYLMNIRKIKTNETGFLNQMLYQAIFVPEGHDPLPEDVIKHPSLSKYIENWGKDLYDVAFVAEMEDILVGAIWGRLFTKDNKGFGFTDEETPELSMAVKPEFHGKGIGTKMFDAIVSEYQKSGVMYLCLSVDKANAAVRLYQRHGFETVDETQTFLTMRKKLK